MYLVRLLAVAVLVTAFAVLGGGPGLSADEGGDHAAHFLHCAKACADCAIQCDSCHHHCSHMVTSGSKEHAKSMEYCVDCADVCRTAGALSARGSSLATPVCE